MSTAAAALTRRIYTIPPFYPIGTPPSCRETKTASRNTLTLTTAKRTNPRRNRKPNNPAERHPRRLTVPRANPDVLGPNAFCEASVGRAVNDARSRIGPSPNHWHDNSGVRPVAIVPRTWSDRTRIDHWDPPAVRVVGRGPWNDACRLEALRRIISTVSCYQRRRILPYRHPHHHSE